MSIATLLGNLASKRTSLVRKMDETISAITAETSATATGAGVYKHLTDLRWKVDAIDYVLIGFEGETLTEELFRTVFEGVQRDLISLGVAASMSVEQSYGPSYWKELGEIERQMRYEITRLDSSN